MMAWRIPGAVIALMLATATTGSAQAPAACSLAEVLKAGDCFRYNLDMSLTGEMRFRRDSGPVTVKLTASATHAFPERVLALNGAAVKKSARVYDRASVTIERGSDRSVNTLRPSRKLIVSQRQRDDSLVYSPSGALTRAELELVGGHFDVTSLVAALPGKSVKVGETWKLSSSVAQALCGLEGMTENKLEGKLTGVSGGEAKFAFSGTATGVESGALVKLTVEATGTFDTKAGRVTRIDWTQKAERDQGPVSPASTMTMTVRLKREAITQPTELNDVALVAVPQGDTAPPGPMTNLEHRDSKGRFALVHTRDWHLTGVTGEHTILRLMDRGDYIAQVTVTPWTKAKKGEHLSAEDLKKAIAATTTWKQEKELQSGEVPTSDKGRWVYRHSAVGMLSGVSVLQNFYLVAAPSGDQVLLTFTLSPKNADKLGARDLSIVASVEVPATADPK